MLQLISLLTLFVNKRLTYYGKVYFPNSLINLSITKYAFKKPKLKQKQEKEKVVAKDFDFLYSAGHAS